MPLTDIETRGSDDWYVSYLGKQLGAKFPHLYELKKYKTGEAPVRDIEDATVRDTVTRFWNMCRLNFADRIVSAVTSGKKPVGFRTAAADDEMGDQIAQSAWRANKMDLQYRDLADFEGTYGSAYAIVTQNDVADQQQDLVRQLGDTEGDESAQSSGEKVSTDQYPVMNVVSPFNCITIQNTTRPWVTDTAILLGRDDVAGIDTITLFTRDGWRVAYKIAEEKSSIPTDGSTWDPGSDWDWLSEKVPYSWTNEVPVVLFQNKDGIGEFEAHTDSLDRINHGILNRLVIASMQAFRQRAITPGTAEGAENLPRTYPDDDERAGEAINYDEIYKAGPASLWFLPKGAQIWESANIDITQFLTEVESELKFLAGAAGIPLYVLSPDAADGSAAGANLAKETLVQACLDRIARDESALARMQYFVFKAMGDEARANEAEITVIWQPVSPDSQLDKATAGAAARNGGLSRRMTNEVFLQLTPEQQEREVQYIQDEALEDAISSSLGSTSSVTTDTSSTTTEESSSTTEDDTEVPVEDEGAE